MSDARVTAIVHDFWTRYEVADPSTTHPFSTTAYFAPAKFMAEICTVCKLLGWDDLLNNGSLGRELQRWANTVPVFDFTNQKRVTTLAKIAPTRYDESKERAAMILSSRVYKLAQLVI